MYVIPNSGSISAGSTAGASRSLNLMKNDIVSTIVNARMSLKEMSDYAKDVGIELPNMTVGAPYKYSEFYGADTRIRVLPQYVGALILNAPHCDGCSENYTVTNVASYCNRMPNRIICDIFWNQTCLTINGSSLGCSGNNSSTSTYGYAITITGGAFTVSVSTDGGAGSASIYIISAD